MKDNLYLFIKVVVETSYPNIHDAIDELQTYTDYSIGSTPNVKVLETEIIELDTQNPRSWNGLTTAKTSKKLRQPIKS